MVLVCVRARAYCKCVHVRACIHVCVCVCSSACMYTLLEFSHKDNRTDDDEEDDDGEVSSAASAATPVSTKKSGSKKSGSRFVRFYAQEYLGFQRLLFFLQSV